MLLSVENLTVTGHLGKVLIQNLSFELPSGKLLLIQGPNGSGKSTLLRTILGDQRRASGTIQFFLAPERIQYIPQLENTDIHWPLTLYDVLKVSVPGQLDRNAVLQFGLMEMHQLDLAWNTASGGERKKTLLTRALLRNPQLLVFDEPMNHLDVDSRRRIVGAMESFLYGAQYDAVGSPRSIILVSHVGFHADEEKRFDKVQLVLGEC